MKPSGGAIKTLRHNVPVLAKEMKRGFHLRGMLFCCCCCCCCCGLPACQHTGISTNISTKPVQSISTMSPTAAHVECTRRAGCKRGASKGQGYVRGGVCVVEGREDHLRPLESTKQPQRRRSATSCAARLKCQERLPLRWRRSRRSEGRRGIPLSYLRGGQVPLRYRPTPQRLKGHSRVLPDLLVLRAPDAAH
jgi:hypothetical protein